MQYYFFIIVIFLIFLITAFILFYLNQVSILNIQGRIKRFVLNKKNIKSSLFIQKNKKENKSLRVELQEKKIAHIVEKLDLRKLFVDEAVIDALTIAGYHRKKHITIFLFSRVIGIFCGFIFGSIFMFFLGSTLLPDMIMYQMLSVLVFCYIGFWFPIIFVRNRAKARKKSITKFYPDALDLMLICIESGLSFELTVKKVAEEIATQSVALSEELELLNAELSFLDERKKAYENFSRRIGLKSIKSTCIALIQAEQYGTPIGNVLRILSNELREIRQLEAEKKAAALPPKLTVPMIVFFLPIIFSIIIGPIYIKVMATPGLF